jgi:hypothetical protein
MCRQARFTRSLVSSVPSLRPSSAPCELLLKLFTGQRGAVHLGRLLRGEDAGRFVLLREVAESAVAPLASDVDIARSIAHPKLLKLLGVLRSEGDAYLASEYVPGVALTELRDAVRKTGVPIRGSVAARIVRDALDASMVASKLLKDAAGIDAINAFHPDAIWIAEFGETLLSLVAPEQTSGSIAPSGVGTDSAVGLIMQLATGLSPTQVLSDGVASHFPAALSEALSNALARAARSRAAGEAALLEGLNALPAALLATDEQVKQELQRLVPGALLLRRGLQGIEQQDEHELGANEATVVSRLPKAARVMMDAEEPTRAFRLDPSKRDEDPDGITELIQRALPSVIVSPDASLPKPSTPPASEWAKQFLENTQPSVRRAQSAPPVASTAPAATRRKALLFAALMLVVLLVATVWFLRQRH